MFGIGKSAGLFMCLTLHERYSCLGNRVRNHGLVDLGSV